MKNKCTIVNRNYKTQVTFDFDINKNIILYMYINIYRQSLGKNILQYLVNSYSRSCLVPHNHLNRILPKY